jgi:hypothetical protein
MRYEGKLYGKVGKHYFPLEATSEDFDKNKELLKKSRDLLLMCTLLDKSGQCSELVDKIDESLNDNWME